MSLYQFLIAVRQQDGQQLTSETGETTSHLMGMFYRTLKIVDNGLKPMYVFDGKPPELKGAELSKRLEKREAALKQAEGLKETGTAEDISRFERRTVKVTKEQNEEAKKLLKLMGIPCIDAPCEAEAQCAFLAKHDKCYAAASEDMDTLTFGTPVLLRHLTASDQKKNPVTEVNLSKALDGLGLNKDEFIDLCILLGCDYCEPIRGVGPTTALKLVKEYRSIENIIAGLKVKPQGKILIPDDWPFEEVRKLFHQPDVLGSKLVDLKWNEPDVEGLVDFLVKEKGFSEDRVRSGAARLTKGVKTVPQGRLTDFFKVKPVDPAAKRKGDDKTTVKSKKIKK
jgi:flap endonuclease-1